MVTCYFKKLRYLLYIFIFCLSACKQSDSTQDIKNVVAKNIKPPVKIKVKNVVTYAAGTPFKIEIPTVKGTRTLPGGRVIEMAPPTKVNLIGSEALGFAHTQHYNVDEGLALSSVYSSYVDNKGRLWFGTIGGGVSCYDGKSFTNYSISDGLISNIITSITQDVKGNIWLAADMGVSCYDGKSFKSYTTQNGMPEGIVWCTYADKRGNVWFATEAGGIGCYNGSTIKSYTTKQGVPSNKINSITSDSKGNIWFATDSGASCYNGKSFINYNATNGWVNDGIRCIAQDKKGNFWFVTHDGLSCYDGKIKTNYTKADGLASNSITSILQDKVGNLWFGTEKGVSCYDGKSFTTYTTTWGLTGGAVNTIAEDKAGNLWIGTDGFGVVRYDGNVFNDYSTKQGIGNDIVWVFAEDTKGSIWMGTDGGGVSCYDGKSITTYSIGQGLANNKIDGIWKDKKGDLWLASGGGGLIHYDGKSFSNYNKAQGLLNSQPKKILEDRKGNLWIATGDGAINFDGTRFTNYTTQQGLVSNDVWFIKEDRLGKIWFATTSGVSCYDGTFFTTYTIEQGLASNTTYSITEDINGNIWIGTNNGVSRYDGKSFQNYTTADGLTDDVVSSVIADKQDNLLLGTNLGFTRLVGYECSSKGNSNNSKKIISATNKFSNEELQQLNAKPIFEQYHFKNGANIKDVNSNAMYCDSKGMIWIGTGEKVVRFNPFAIRKSKEPLFVALQNLKVDNENVSWYNLLSNKEATSSIDSATLIGERAVEERRLVGRTLSSDELNHMRNKFSDIVFDSISPFYTIPQNLILPYRHNTLTFDFLAIEPARPYLVNYQYILENYDKEWSTANNKTSVTYGHLPEGVYTFKLKAQSPDGVWSKPITYTFKILPPWYRTWWAYIMYVFAISALLYSIYRWRTAALRKENEVLEEKVKERTYQLDQSNIELAAQRDEIQHQKVELEISQKKVIDSINYAKKIQYSTLPSEEEIKPYFPDYFVHFMPKDTISGDFYWFYHNEGLSYIAVADCTGHGVPGALMSMMSYSLLNEVMLDERLSDPSKILSSLHRLVFKTLQQHKGDEYSQDGLDISLCIIDHTNRLLHFSGARNNVFIVNSKEVTVLKATSRSIGGVSLTGEIEPERQFKSETIELKERVLLIMSTDGIFDQLNTTDEKFGTKRFKELVQPLYTKSMEESKETVASTISNWMQTAHQQDDLLVMGLVIE